MLESSLSDPTALSTLVSHGSWYFHEDCCQVCPHCFFSCERRKFERSQQSGASEPMMCKNAAPKLAAKFGDLAVTKDSRGSPRKGNERLFPSQGANSISKCERGRKRDDLSKSEHISSRKRDDLSKSSKSEHISSRKRDDLSKSEHGNRKSDELSRSSSRKRDDLIMSEHTSRCRSSHEEKPLSRQRRLLSPIPPTSTTHSAEVFLRKSLSPGPLKSRRSSTSTATRRRRDDLSQSEHWKPRRDELPESEHWMPRLRRDALNSRNVGKNELDTSRRSRSSTRRQGSDRSHSGDAKPHIRSIEQKPRRRGSSVEAPDKEQSSPTGRRSGSSSRREHRGSGMPTDAHSLPRRSSGSKRAPVTDESKSSVLSLPRRSSGSKRVPLTEESKPMHRSKSHASCGGMVPRGSRNNLKTIGDCTSIRDTRYCNSSLDARQ
jgi:hypothetical protein